MKKLLVFFLLFPSLCLAASAVKNYNGVVDSSVKLIQGKTSADVKTANGVDYNDQDSTADSCTGGLLLSAHFENSDTVTSGTPTGCNSNADQTWTLGANTAYSTTQKSDGSYSIAATSDMGHVKSAVIGIDDCADEGTLIFDIFTDVGIVNGARYAYLYIDANNFVEVFGDSSSRLGATLRANGNYYPTGLVTVGTDAFHTITVKWSSTHNPSTSIQVDSGTASTSSGAVSSAIVGSFTTLQLGKGTSYDGEEWFIDKVQLWDSWK